MRIELSPPAWIHIKDFHGLSSSIKNFHKPMRDIVDEVILPSLADSWAEGGRPPWPLHAESTIRKMGPHELLIWSGDLQKAVLNRKNWSYTDNMAFLPFLPEDVWYGNVHLEGSISKNIPVRDFLVLQDEDEDAMAEVMLRHLDDSLDKNAFGIGGAVTRAALGRIMSFHVGGLDNLV